MLARRYEYIIIMQIQTYDLQPIVKNKPRRAIVKRDRSKHCRSVVTGQIATNRTINESYDPV